MDTVIGVNGPSVIKNAVKECNSVNVLATAQSPLEEVMTVKLWVTQLNQENVCSKNAQVR